MSRSEEFKQNLTNPANLRLTWKSAEKRYISYNTITKTKETLGNIEFIVLSETVSICGFNEAQNMGIFSNEIKNTKTEELVVRTKNGILISGLYSDIKEKLGPLGGNFANNLSIKLKTGELAVLQLSGAALKVWFDYKELNKGKLLSNWVTTTGITEMKKGAVKYCVPVLTLGSILTKDEDVSAENDYEKIKAYRNSFLEKTSLDAILQEHNTGMDEAIDDIPY